MAEPVYRISVVAETTGLSVGLIRAWERRHGVLKPQRTAGGYRVYARRDIEVLQRLKQLTEEGVSIGEAIQLLPDIQSKVEAAGHKASAASTQLAHWQQEIGAAAVEYDQRRLDAALDEALGTLSALATVTSLLLPALKEVGERWHRGEITVAGEHLVTHAIRDRLAALIQVAPQGSRGHVVCACLPDEQHEIGLLHATLRLRHAGFRVTYLGARTPAADLAVLVRKARPSLVALAAVNLTGKRRFETSLKSVLSALPSGTPVWIGGAAAAKYREVCEALKVQVVLTEADWARALA